MIALISRLFGRPFILWIWLAYWLLMFAATHTPVPRGMHLPVKNGDKIIHFLLYFLLTLLGGRVILARGKGLTIAVVLVWAAIYLAYGAFDEISQSWDFVRRSTSLGDWLANATGVTVGSMLLLTLQSRRAGDGDSGLAGSAD